MEYSRILNMPPKEAINSIKSQCNCNITLFRMVEMSFLPQKISVFFAYPIRIVCFFLLTGKKHLALMLPKGTLKLNYCITIARLFYTGDFASPFFSPIYSLLLFLAF